MKRKTPKTGSSQVVVDMDRLPPRFQPDFERDPDGRWLAVIKTGAANIMANGNTKDEAAGHALELLLVALNDLLADRSSFADSLASASVEDEEITPEQADRIDRARRSLDRGEGISHDGILREFGLKK